MAQPQMFVVSDLEGVLAGPRAFCVRDRHGHAPGTVVWSNVAPHAWRPWPHADIFLPSPSDLLANVKECEEILFQLLDKLPTLFANSRNPLSALGPALQAAFKLMVRKLFAGFMCTLPSFGGVFFAALDLPLIGWSGYLTATPLVQSPTGGRIMAFQCGLPSAGVGKLANRENPSVRNTPKVR
jgi:protein transport protein SEC24